MAKVFVGDQQAIALYYGKDMRRPLSINVSDSNSSVTTNDIRNLKIPQSRLLTEAFVYDSFPEEYRYDTYHAFIRKK